ncbi:tyrosine-type recombinase/integrase, partial [candidate division WWE3 bacterium]|nr:tyrosine-type recombinase/integrase [candidate division WWE3 bacterium]
AYSKDIEQLLEYVQQAHHVQMITNLELTHLEAFMDKLSTEDYTPKSISRKTNSTKTFFRFLVDNELIAHNTADKLKHPQVEIKEPRILSRLEYGALRDAAKNDSRAFAVIEVLLQTGARISELANIKLDHIIEDNNKKQLHIPKRDGYAERTILLNKAAISAIEDYLNERPQIEESKHLFITKTGRPLLVRNIRATITRYFKLAGIENAKVNDLRHTFVAHHLAQGTNMITVSKIAGHKRISTTERYLQYIDKVSSDEKTELGVL